MKIKSILLYLSTLLILFTIFSFHQGAEGEADSFQSKNSEVNKVTPRKLKSKHKVMLTNIATKNIKQNARSVSSLKETSIASFFESTEEKKWVFKKDKEGQVRKIYGDEIENIVESEATARVFLKNLEDHLKLPENSLTHRVESKNTRDLKVFDSVQTYQGLEVFDAYFRMIGNKDSLAAFLFNNHLKELQTSDIKTQTRLDSMELTQIAMNHYGEDLTEIKSISSPIVWANSSPNQLAYQLQLRTKKDDLLVVVGAQTKSVIYSRSERFH